MSRYVFQIDGGFWISSPVTREEWYYGMPGQLSFDTCEEALAGARDQAVQDAALAESERLRGE